MMKCPKLKHLNLHRRLQNSEYSHPVSIRSPITTFEILVQCYLYLYLLKFRIGKFCKLEYKYELCSKHNVYVGIRCPVFAKGLNRVKLCSAIIFPRVKAYSRRVIPTSLNAYVPHVLCFKR